MFGGHQYILTVMDQATRYPEAVALRTIGTEAVAEALWGIWSRFGTPREILTDQGSNFMSGLIAEVNRLLAIEHHPVSAYHPIGNGMIERFNKTLKQTLKKLCAVQPKDWDRYLPAALFAYREVPQASTGFSPFEMLYGRNVRGPMTILKQLWTDEKAEDEACTSYQYVTDLRHRMESMCELAQDNLKLAKQRQKIHYDKKTRERVHEVGERVLLLLPVKRNKLQLEWKGPFEITERVSAQTYRVLVKGKPKVFHANLLKRYVGREDALVVATVVYEEPGTTESTADTVSCCPVTSKETVQDVKVSEHLTSAQTAQVTQLLERYKDVWTDKPGLTSLAEFEVRLTSSVPVKCKPYPLLHAKREVVKK